MRTIIFAIALLTGCQNTCQQLCLDMADYAESDCDQTFKDTEMDSCLEKYSEASEKELDTCATYGDKISEEWSCSDIGAYFD
jgi:hypothetical protein